MRFRYVIDLASLNGDTAGLIGRRVNDPEAKVGGAGTVRVTGSPTATLPAPTA